MKAFLDTETTGNKHTQIAQLSYIITDDDLNVVMAKNFFFKVAAMNPFALKLHGLSLKKLEELSQGKSFADHIDEIEQDLSNCQLVCHNYRSDHDILATEFKRLGRKFRPASGFCTMAHFRPVCVIADKEGKNKNPSLKEIVSFFAIDNEEISQCTSELFGLENLPSHDSRYDTAAVFLVCKTALDHEDYYCHDIDETQSSTPTPPVGQIVSLNEQRRRKAQREKDAQQKRMRRLPKRAAQAPFARYAIPVLIGLVIISILLRM